MQKQDTWLSGVDAAELLSIRQARLAQCIRAGLVPYQTAVGGILIHKKDVRAFQLHFPELLLHFQTELEVDKHVEEGELIFECQNFPPPGVLKLLKCVEAREGSFPS